MHMMEVMVMLMMEVMVMHMMKVMMIVKEEMIPMTMERVIDENEMLNHPKIMKFIDINKQENFLVSFCSSSLKIKRDKQID